MIHMKITVFCGSRDGNRPIYKETAFVLGAYLAKKWHTLVYGGSSVWLMWAVSEWALEHDGRIIGVFPKTINPSEKARITDKIKFIETENMHHRKKELVRRADAVIILPGWWGSMDELFEVLTLNQLKTTNIPVGILNIEGYYDSLITLFEHMKSEWFIDPKHEKWISHDSSIEWLFRKMDIME